MGCLKCISKSTLSGSMVHNGVHNSKTIPNFFMVPYQVIKQVDDHTKNRNDNLFSLFIAVPLFSNISYATFAWDEIQYGIYPSILGSKQ